MAKNLDNLSIKDLLPANLLSDEDVAAIAQAITPEFQEISRLMKMLDPKEDVLKFLSEENQHKYLDSLAFEKHIDFYDTSLSIEKKKELIEKARFFHRKKGTPAAVEDLITSIFGEGKVVEWFEYDASPGYFKVVTSNTSVTNEQAEQFIRALNSVKRKSSVLDKVEITQIDNMNLYFGGVVHVGDKYTLKQVI